MTLEEEKLPLFYSLFLHGVILLVLVVKPYFSKEIKPFERTIKVDIVAMPEKHQKIVKEAVDKGVKKTEKAAPKPLVKEKKPEPKEVAAKKTATEKSNPKEIQKAKEKAAVSEPQVEETGLSEGDALKKLADMKKEKAALAALEQQKAIAGNRLSKGSDLVGVEKLEYTNYKTTLHRAISAEWDLPKWLLEGKLRAIAFIKIDEEGNLIERRLVESSGNTIYDEKVMEAIEDSSPFDPPPEKFKNIVRFEGVLLTFP